MNNGAHFLCVSNILEHAGADATLKGAGSRAEGCKRARARLLKE